ncbi:MAG: stage III sporulation protein AA [Bacillota bacterium]|nr:stage III sporulation protein AA [Bacillota bacterium]
MNKLEEIRLKVDTDTILICEGKEYIIENSKYITSEVLEEILAKLVDYSYYAYEDELSKGYITIEGGHRVGICGRVTLKYGKVDLIKDVSSMNIRRSRQIIGSADRVMKYITDGETVCNTLIISPPKCGKTTLIRDISRHLSENGYRVSICDERSEIAGCCIGKPAYDIGQRTDVLDGCPKAIGIVMLIRSMAPDVIITDEIGRSEDINAISDALSSGVNIITTIHGNDMKDIRNSFLREFIDKGVFETLIFLTSEPEAGTVKEVLKFDKESCSYG